MSQKNPKYAFESVPLPIVYQGADPCQNCGRPIHPDRRTALPETTTCVLCSVEPRKAVDVDGTDPDELRRAALHPS